MLKLIDIVKEYKVDEESVLALKHVSIEFRRNEFVSILGPSGCGKTTLLNIVGGLDRYTSGDIQIEGISTTQYDDVDWDTYRNRRIGFVFQSYNLIPHMTILKNVALALTIAGVSRDERKQRALEALRKVGLESQANKKPNQLSGGQMQRVAIARALVNNPEIILADEPTGALDTESGVQVMELLKEVADDRLVIMVTHNPDLAQKYSTRIVYLRDGEIEGDTMPYDSAEEESGAEKEASAEDVAAVEESGETAGESGEPVLDANSEGENAPSKQSEAKQKKTSKLREKLRKIRKADKAAMKFSTAISLSWNNLISKKGRTLLTSIAGSIGIIGIILVLALSNGAGDYINSLEESALSSYPITVNQNSMDGMEIISKMMNAMASDDDHFSDDTIKVQKVLGNVLEEFETMTKGSQNDLYSFKKYVDANFDRTLADVKYNYGTTFNCYVADKGNAERYMKVNPYTETMQTVLEGLLKNPVIQGMLKDFKITIMGKEYELDEALSYLTDFVGSAWSEMSDNMEMLQSQYELVTSRSHWPRSADEVVIVVNENNRLMDYQLFMLGLQSQDDVVNAMLPGGKFGEEDYSIDELLGLEYKVMNNVDYLEEGEEPNTWIMHPRTEQNIQYLEKNLKFVEFPDGSDHIRVSGVVRPKKGAVATSITGVIGYTSQLTDYLFKKASEHPAVIELNKRFNEALEKFENGDPNSYKYISPIEYYYKANKDSAGGAGVDVKIGDEIDFTNNSELSHDTAHFAILRQLGLADIEYPQSIEFYCSSFDTKHAVEEFIARYNSIDEDKTITYTDSLQTMMRFIDTMATTITGVLVAFAAISLIVSTIMIAIIIYTSVLERRKEIGVLRSIGARKKDISRVFIAESAILGGYSGVIGAVVSFLISLAGSAILTVVFGISGLMTVTWWHCVLMIGISMLLSMLAGFIPSRIAANKDPAIALRSE